MKNNPIVLLFTIAICFLLIGCGPSAPKSLKLPEIKIREVGKKVKGPDDEASYIFVDDFIDARIEQSIAEVDGTKVPPEGDTSVFVRAGLRQALERKGFVFSDTAPIVLSGELRKWKADVVGGFSSTIRSEASLYVEILDPANKRIYAGVYNGFSNIEGNSLGAEDIQEALRISMQEAVRQVIKDMQLIKLLSSF